MRKGNEEGGGRGERKMGEEGIGKGGGRGGDGKYLEFEGFLSFGRILFFILKIWESV